MKLSPDSQERLTAIRVLVAYIEMEISSHSMPSKAADRLVKDVHAIGDRAEAVFTTDDGERRKRKRGRP